LLRATLFDFDGVLADTEPLHFVGFAEVLARRGIEVGERLYEERYLGLGTDRDAFRRVAEDFARPDLVPDIPAIVAEKAARLAELLDGAPLCEGAPELVRGLAGECLAIEDSPNGIAAARAAGMRCAAVCQSRPADALRAADLVVPALRDLDVGALRRLFST
jgi:beta-phosphoglucomutase-like phosphatase (HAD superfamily)